MEWEALGIENRHRNPQTGQLDGPLVKVDFAQNAESYGLSRVAGMMSKACWRRWSVPRPSGPVLLDIKVLPKTAAHDYASTVANRRCAGSSVYCRAAKPAAQTQRR